MKEEHEQLLVDFTEKAQKLFTLTYDNFRLSTEKLDRQRDENVFQLQVEKYMATLKHQLGSIANDLLSRNQSLKNIEHRNKLLRDNIDVYLKEFRQKSRSL